MTVANSSRVFRLSTREARQKLPRQHEPYRHEVRRGLHIGYRKGRDGGTWWLREYRDRRQAKRPVGIADDQLDANGETVFSWADLLKIALGETRPTVTRSAAYTLRQAFEDYWEFRAAKSSPHSVLVDQTKVNRDVLPKLGSRDVNELTTYDLQKWRDRQVKPSSDPEILRRQRSSANRAWSVLRACLNHAYNTGKAQSDEAWRRVRPFRGVDMPRTRFLSVEEAKRLLNVMPEDFRQLARGSLYTGLRHGELIALLVSDVTEGQVRVRLSKSGKPRSVPLNDEGGDFFDRMTAGKRGDELVFTRADGSLWYRMQASRYMKDACAAAKIEPPAPFHDLRHSYASLLINRGTDAEIIKELLGHADLRMTLRTYAHLLNRTVAKAVKRKLPSFGLEPSKVIKFRS
jgi:integrase